MNSHYLHKEKGDYAYVVLAHKQKHNCTALHMTADKR